MIDFNEVYRIMKESFPESEMRSFEGQKNLLTKSNYKIVPKYDKSKKTLIAFIATWEFDDFVFIEHLAVTNKMRGQGIGGKLLKDYVNSCKNKRLILEVEPPYDDVSKRRIEFYERIGFHLHPFYYEQPPLQKDFDYIQLKIMVYPEKISEKEFTKIKKEIYKTVYKV